jgi:hypothetical protein
MDDMNCIIEGTGDVGAIWLGNLEAASNRLLILY